MDHLYQIRFFVVEIRSQFRYFFKFWFDIWALHEFPQAKWKRTEFLHVPIGHFIKLPTIQYDKAILRWKIWYSIIFDCQTGNGTFFSPPEQVVSSSSSKKNKMFHPNQLVHSNYIYRWKMNEKFSPSMYTWAWVCICVCMYLVCARELHCMWLDSTSCHKFVPISHLI